MNIANRLTCLRIVISFFCIACVIQNTLLSLAVAFALFIIASITDFLDGYYARKLDLISDLGKILDPIADKILIIGVFIAFTQLDVVSVWIVVGIMLREFIVTGLRFYSLNKGVVLEAKMWGKHKTVSQIAGIILIFIVLIFIKIYPESQVVLFFRNQIITLVMIYILAITLFSGIYYFWVNRKVISTF